MVVNSGIVPLMIIGRGVYEQNRTVNVGAASSSQKSRYYQNKWRGRNDCLRKGIGMTGGQRKFTSDNTKPG